MTFQELGYRDMFPLSLPFQQILVDELVHGLLLSFIEGIAGIEQPGRTLSFEIAKGQFGAVDLH
jgi:hypothetical protein